MRRMDIGEFADCIDTPFDPDEPLIVTHHGHAIGAYLPLPMPDKAAAERASAELAETLRRIYARTGMSEEELVAAFLQEA